MVDEIRTRFNITDEEALYIKQVTEEKVADPVIRTTVTSHREDRIYLDGAYRGQVNGEIQTAYDDRGRYEELSDPKYRRWRHLRHNGRYRYPASFSCLNISGPKGA